MITSADGTPARRRSRPVSDVATPPRCDAARLLLGWCLTSSVGVVDGALVVEVAATFVGGELAREEGACELDELGGVVGVATDRTAVAVEQAAAWIEGDPWWPGGVGKVEL